MKKHTEQHAGQRTLDRVLAFAGKSGWIRPALHFLPPGMRATISRVVQNRRRNALAFPGSARWASPVSAHYEGVSGGHLSSFTGRSAHDQRVPGVNVICYAYGQFGLAEAARLYMAALRQAGFALAVHDAGIEIPHENANTEIQPCISEQAPYEDSLIFINPDHLLQVVETLDFPLQRGRRNIGVWFWELERFPKAWLPALDLVDEVIVASHFVEEAVREVTRKPVTVIPQPLVEYPRSGLTRRDFGLDDAFTYLTTFDFNSSMARKNPLGVVEAFVKAFPDQDADVCLLIKSANGHRYPAQLELLLKAAARDKRIIVRDQVLARPHLTALFACTDAYISLHRSEGYGLGPAEAMWLGKPVVATAYSGNLDFMTSQNSYLVDHDRVPVKQGEYIHWEGQFWAEPDIDDAARQIRHVYIDPDVRHSRSEAARNSIRGAGLLEACGQALRERLHGNMHSGEEMERQTQ